MDGALLQSHLGIEIKHLAQIRKLPKWDVVYCKADILAYYTPAWAPFTNICGMFALIHALTSTVV